MTRRKRKVAIDSSSREATIYMGPNIPGGKLARYTVFRGGVTPAYVDRLAEDCKAIQALIVPVSKLAETERNIARTGSLEQARFAEISKHYTKGVR